MFLQSQLILKSCNCGLSRTQIPLLRTSQAFLSTKPPNETEESGNRSKPVNRLNDSGQLKKLSAQGQKYAELLKKRYEETLKLGSQWYHDKIRQITQNKSGIGGDEWYSAQVGFWMKRYENFVGLTEVKAAQHCVVETENLFIQAQEARREAQSAINAVQSKIKALHAELEKTHRGEDRYLTLVTQEHQILKEERILIEQLQALEKTERQRFSELSNAVRDSHEKERAQAEKTKYWSVIGSVVGTCLGILGTTINNRLRMKELRQIVKDASGLSASGLVSSSRDLHLMSSQQMQEYFEAQQKQLKVISEKIVSIQKETPSKPPDLSPLINSLSEAVKSFNAAKSEFLQARPATPSGLISKELQTFFENEMKFLEKLFADLRLALVGQTAAAHENFSIEHLRRSEESEKRIIEALNRTNVASYKAFHTRACDIDEKVKDIRSLILAQSVANVGSSSKAVKSDFKRSQLTVIGTVESALKEHEERVQNSLFLAGIFTAIMTPVVLFFLNKLS